MKTNSQGQWEEQPDTKKYTSSRRKKNITNELFYFCFIYNLLSLSNYFNFILVYFCFPPYHLFNN